MSRSYKRYPIVKQEKVHKKSWNRMIRNLDYDYVLRGSQYKKIYPNWETWQYPWFFEDAMESFEKGAWQNSFVTKEEFINYWKRCCYRK